MPERTDGGDSHFAGAAGGIGVVATGGRGGAGGTAPRTGPTWASPEGMVRFHCPNCHDELAVAPVIKSLVHRADYIASTAAGSRVSASGMIDVEFEPLAVPHSCPSRRLVIRG